jgi:hypothetical protein
MPGVKEIIPLESEEQAALFQWARIMENKVPELRLLYHIPNGGLRNKPIAVRLTAEGVRRGVPDMCLPVARGAYHGLYIELKRRKGSKITPEQQDWIERLRKEGYAAVICYGWEKAREVLEDYLKGTKWDEFQKDICDVISKRHCTNNLKNQKE